MQSMTMLTLLAITGVMATEATRTLFGNGRVSAASHKKKHHHHHNGFFEVLLKDFHEHPKDEKEFNTRCEKIVVELLPELREEYTQKQVPTVLRDSCEVMRHKEDFIKDEHGNKLTEPVLNRAQVQCKYFATQLSDQYAGKKDYGGWCKSVFDYLTHISISSEEVSRRIKERNVARANLQKIKEEWDRFRDIKGKAWAQRNKFKRHLSDFEDDYTFGAPSPAKNKDAAPASDGDNSTAGKNITGDAADVEWEEEEEDDDEDDDKWRKCCPKGCKVCPGFNLKEGIVRASGSVNFMKTVTEASEEAEDTDSEDSEEASEDGDAEEESDEDSDEDAEDEEELMEDDDDSEEADEEESGDEDDDEAEEAEEDADEDDKDEDPLETAAKVSLLQRRHHSKPSTKSTKKNVSPAKKKHTSPAKKKKLSAKKNATMPFSVSEPVHLRGGFYYLLTREFQRLPKTEEFLDRCTKVISKLMPDLHEEYTWKQVPNVLKHDCEVYATKTDFKTERMQLDHAGKSCKFFAKRLAQRFKTDKDYKEWCSNVYAHLLRESDMKGLTDKQKELLKTHKNFGKEIYDLEDDCCPANCRMC